MLNRSMTPENDYGAAQYICRYLNIVMYLR
jgi:hypothetical protein